MPDRKPEFIDPFRDRARDPEAVPPPAAADGDGDSEDDAEGEDDLPPEVFVHQVTKRMAGRRLDKFLRERHPRISRTMLQKYIKEGAVTVNGKPSKASYEPSCGDEVQVKLPPPTPIEVIPEDIPIDVIYEDEYLLAVNKHVGIVCHPGYPGQHGTIANAVAFHAESLSRGTDPWRPGIVHRLDKNTTGIMVIAKCDEAHWRISQQFERRTTRKEYFAIAEGSIALDGDIIDQPLAPHPQTSKRMVLPGGAQPPRQAMFKEAVTRYQVHKRYRGFTTVQLFPKTGRTHQLRVHLMSIGHSIMGDTFYGGHLHSARDLSGNELDDERPLIEYQALHARRLAFTHPITEEPMEIEAPLPAQMQRILDLLEEHRKL